MTQRGFTLPEALITLALTLAVSLWSASAMTGLFANNRRDAAINDLLASVNFARGQAIVSGTRMTVCASSSQQFCESSQGWEQGWLVFSDHSNPGVVDGAERIYREHGPLAAGLSLRGNGNLVSRISFGPLGTSQGFAGTMTLCDRRGFGAPPAVHARQVKFSTGGRARVVVPEAGGSCA